jgi:hypothetical protein
MLLREQQTVVLARHRMMKTSLHVRAVGEQTPAARKSALTDMSGAIS